MRILPVRILLTMRILAMIILDGVYGAGDDENTVNGDDSVDEDNGDGDGADDFVGKCGGDDVVDDDDDDDHGRRGV